MQVSCGSFWAEAALERIKVDACAPTRAHGIPDILKMVQNGEAKCCTSRLLTGIEEKLLEEAGSPVKNTPKRSSFTSEAASGTDEPKKPAAPPPLNEAAQTKNEPIADKAASWSSQKQENNYAVSKDYFPRQEAYIQAPRGMSNQILHGVIAFAMGIVTMVRLTRNIPRKLADAALYSSPGDYCVDTMMRGQAHQLPAPTTISSDEHMALLKRMAELEAIMSSFSPKPPVMPREKQELLDAAVSRIKALEQELFSDKKALEEAVARQGELVAYVEKKKKKKRFW